MRGLMRRLMRRLMAPAPASGQVSRQPQRLSLSLEASSTFIGLTDQLRPDLLAIERTMQMLTSDECIQWPRWECCCGTWD
ncbi:hypothetical protein OIDMADRAFT_176896 [Oidiodendron maius Zn]|uniref:Uncharacterized protein n=1 Tax=Oidiodendron maius (strain Zn) TaxID=913774 RepID=A0A0C3CZN2_OIDMZ|nr:hypothetical protein OIDMADRAFT_176896 [Oidiodendron maius Zn]